MSTTRTPHHRPSTPLVVDAGPPRRNGGADLAVASRLCVAIGDAGGFDDAVTTVVREICVATGWVVGQAWRATNDRTTFECSPVWYRGSTEGRELDRFRAQSLVGDLPLGASLPGRVLASGRIEAFADVATEERSRRSDAARRAGLNSAVAFAVLDDEGVVAVLEFFANDRRPIDQPLRDLMSIAAMALGMVARGEALEAATRRVGRGEPSTLRMLDDVAEQRDRMVRGIVHELSSPLGAIRSLGSVLARSGDDVVRERVAPNLDRAVDEIERFIEDLVELSTIDRGAAWPHRRSVDVSALARDVVDRSEGARPRIQIHATPVDVLLDRSKVEAILDGLLALASRRSPPGAAIRVTVEPCRSGALVSVEDRGPSVAPIAGTGIFEPFARVDGASWARGMGLRLPLVSAYARLHGGRIWVDETVSGSTTFNVYLPGARRRRRAPSGSGSG